MDRRSFVGVLGAVSALAASPEKRTHFYALESFKLKAGTQLPRLHDHFGKTLLPRLNGLWNGPKIFLEAIVAPHMPQVLVVYGFSSLDEMWGIHSKVLADPDLAKAFESLESGPESSPEPSFDTLDTTLVEAAPYSPEITPTTSGKPRIFELRVYHSPTYRQLGALHDRFAGPEIKIFHRSGIHPILYSSTLIGQNIPNLTYLIPFDSLAHRESAWSAFTADPEWVKVRKESIDKHGQISSVQNISLWRAADYSPIK
jgi:hypothetical protein